MASTTDTSPPATSTTYTGAPSDPAQVPAPVSPDIVAPPPKTNITAPELQSPWYRPASPVLPAPSEPSVEATSQPLAAVSPPAAVNVDPRIQTLVAMFPDFDHAILLDILESVNGNEDQAVDILLGMSDPNHVPSNTIASSSSPVSLHFISRAPINPEPEPDGPRRATCSSSLP